MPAELHNLQTRKNIGKAKGLLHSLVPRAQCFCFYDAERDCIWSSDGADDQEVDDFVVDLPEEVITETEQDAGVIKRTLNSGRTLLLLPVVDEDLCTACGDCVDVCPLDLFHLQPLDEPVVVQCSAPLAGDPARAACRSGSAHMFTGTANSMPSWRGHLCQYRRSKA